MADTTTKDGLITHYCGKCGKPLDDHHQLHIRIPVANLFGDKGGFILICDICGREMFPFTNTFDREDLDE